ncbi:hypothetical protein B5F75_05695 [Candidatus Avelusimicrobium gallicola]|uniref:Uncharacterized protein n=1 Tax=Candidatus Avelusimicrobium gallicola TaxID=2562704 RepID=A0A1Y4DA69_9BACT|nr:hypothetical protein B5F75_05695 [Elusimicrobium sp. An273]
MLLLDFWLPFVPKQALFVKSGRFSRKANFCKNRFFFAFQKEKILLILKIIQAYKIKNRRKFGGGFKT